jgi:hypothetical protein
MGVRVLRSNYIEGLLHSNRRQNWRCNGTILVLRRDLWHIGWDLAEVSRRRVLGHSRSLSVEDLLSSIRWCLGVSINKVAATLSMASWVTVVGIETLVRDGACGCWICCLVLWWRRR